MNAQHTRTRAAWHPGAQAYILRMRTPEGWTEVGHYPITPGDPSAGEQLERDQAALEAGGAARARTLRALEDAGRTR